MVEYHIDRGSYTVIGDIIDATITFTAGGTAVMDGSVPSAFFINYEFTYGSPQQVVYSVRNNICDLCDLPSYPTLTFPLDFRTFDVTSGGLNLFNATNGIAYLDVRLPDGLTLANQVAVSEPATWILLILGFVGIAAQRRLRRSAVLLGHHFVRRTI
jgi:hypothetical protein